MSSLFDTPLIDGLFYRGDFISEADEREIIQHAQDLALAPFKFHGWLGNRKTRSFGWLYDFDDASFTPTDPIPDWLVPLRDRAARFAGATADEIHHALIARYDPGAGIGWHKDRDVFEQVIGVSLHTPATLRFRQRAGAGFRRAALDVLPRSAYLLSGEARWDWEHRITPGDALRFSITFRTLSAKGRTIAQRIS